MQDHGQPYSITNKVGIVVGPLLFLTLYNLPFTLLDPAADKVIAVAAWMITWWVTEAVSISVTALIPLVMFPLLGIMDIKKVSANYGSSTVFLFFGGFVMALALEKVGLHKRIALNIIHLTGTSPNRVVLGFMIATASLSMWISNTATTVVMLPIALSVIHLFIRSSKEITVEQQKSNANFSLSLMLGIAYAANVGGIATLIGTPPNLVIAAFMENEYNIQISFVKWMIMAVPFASIMLAFIYFVLVKWIYPSDVVAAQDVSQESSVSNRIIAQALEKLGAMKKAEIRVLIIFVLTILMWVSRTTINDLLPFISLSDTGISMLAAFALFTIPFNFKRGEFTLSWDDTVKLPWGILILFGGGLALASGLSQNGVIDFIGQAVSENKALSALLVSILLITVVLFMTELMSNVALVAIFAPVIAGIALGLDAQVLHFLIPVAMASSCAFMLPMATPPNAIVFASGHIKVYQMVRAGIVLNIVSICSLILFAKYIIPKFF